MHRSCFLIWNGLSCSLKLHQISGRIRMTTGVLFEFALLFCCFGILPVLQVFWGAIHSSLLQEASISNTITISSQFALTRTCKRFNPLRSRSMSVSLITVAQQHCDKSNQIESNMYHAGHSCLQRLQPARIKNLKCQPSSQFNLTKSKTTIPNAVATSWHCLDTSSATRRCPRMLWRAAVASKRPFRISTPKKGKKGLKWGKKVWQKQNVWEWGHW